MANDNLETILGVKLILPSQEPQNTSTTSDTQTDREPDQEYDVLNVREIEHYTVKLGRQGENDTQNVRIDCSDWLSELPNCELMIAALRPGEREIYVPDVTVSGGVVTWPIMAQDTALAGVGRAEVRALLNEKVKKSVLFKTRIEPALDGNVGGVPTTPPNWVKETKDALDQANEMLADALDTAASLSRDAAAARDQAVQEIGEAADVIRTSTVEQAETDMEEAKAEKLEELNAVKSNADRIAQGCVEVSQASNAMAAQALEKAGNAENEVAETAVKVDQMGTDIDSMALQLAGCVDGGFVENGVAYFTAGDQVLFEITGIGGGGGGGGDSGNNAVIRVENTSGWMSKTIARDDTCPVSFNWSSIENDMPTGNGSLRVQVSGSTKATLEVAQGDVTVDVAQYLSAGANTVALTVSDIYGNNRTIRVTVTVVVLTLTSSFDASAPYTGVISFPYTPTGSVQKTVHFVLDGEEIGTAVTSVSGRQQSYTIPQQSHGAHALRVWFEAEINGQTVTSNELYYEIICLDPMDMTPVITSAFRRTTDTQYNTINVDYTVYNPAAMTTEVVIYVNGDPATTVTVDRASHVFTYRAERAGTLEIELVTGRPGREDYAVKTWVLEIAPSDIEVEAETEGLLLYLNARGRSNGEAGREQWTYEGISAALTGFNWHINGWLRDDEGVDVLRLCGDARAQVPFQLFGRDFKQTGATIEIEFATREVADYDSVILSCYSGGVGLRITPQAVYFNGAQTAISTLYKENEHVRVTITVGKQADYRLIIVYINGIASRAIQYASGERFDQLSPVGITIGSNDCGIDIYTLRVYAQDLTDRQVLDNWIADTQIGSVMQDRYSRNHVYSVAGDITINTLPGNLPYMLIECETLPQYKGDEQTCSGHYVDPVDGTKSFEFEGCVINVQGTSSAIYYRKNYDMKFKQGFRMAGGTVVERYALRNGSIPFNRFVLKADVASSESANNTGLTMFFNDTCPYKTPEMEANDKVRWGIEGVPIALFWHNPATGVTEFLGKHNFNLPKRCPEPLGFSGDMESWEVERNNSANVKFQDCNFTDQTWDEVEQKYKPTWYDDFEARFPSDEWRDTAKLGEFMRWVVSTDRAQATGDALAESVTYSVPTIAMLNGYSDDDSYTVTEVTEGGVRTGYRITFTKDTPAYRLTKFRAEASEYMELQSAEFYYLFTEMLLMIDSRAKNMFLGFNGGDVTVEGRAMDRKVTFQPYDMDTAVGTNNSGVLMFGFNLEDTDTVSGVISGEGEGSDAPVYNAQDSVLWMNVRDAFRAEITAMYRQLRASRAWTYAELEGRYEAHQAKWSEAIFNEDARIKYLVPLIDPVTVDEDTGRLVRTDRYLTMLQGSKAEQRKWWLYNRFRYMDSKYNTGDATKTINLRLFNSGTLTLTPAIDLYVGVSFGGGTTPQLRRTTAETPVSFTYQSQSGVQEMETWIYSADMIADVGDLSVFYPNELDFSRAVRLRRLQIGSAAAGYSNANLTTLDVRNSALLEYIDCRNCPRLAITVDLEGSPRLREAYFDGTAITGVELHDGGMLETLRLPDTITTLTLMNLDKLTTLEIGGLTHVTRLMLANMDSTVIDPVETLGAIQAGSQVYIDGLDMTVATKAAVESFYALLDTMRGVTRERSASGEWLYHDHDTAQVSGRIHVAGSLTGGEIAALNARYPYIRVEADHVTSHLYYYTWDGSELLYDETVEDQGDGSWTGTGPARASTAQYSYAFAGWSTLMDADTPSEDARRAVLADRSVYAAYSRTVRTYTVTFARQSEDGGGTLQTVTDVPYGGSASYTGETPTTTKGTAEDFPFLSWNPVPENITGATTCYAVFGSPVMVEEITDSWDEILAACANGTYAQKYALGNYKPLDLGSEGVVNMQIVGKDADELADGNGNAPLTWVSMELLNTQHRFNPEVETVYDYVEVDSWTVNGNNRNWISKNLYTESTGKATWTFTAKKDATFSVYYRVYKVTSSDPDTTLNLTVNGNAVVTEYSGSGLSYSLSVSAGETVTVYAEAVNQGGGAYCELSYGLLNDFNMSVEVQKATTRVVDYYVEGTGAIGGWEESELRAYLRDTIKPLIPETVCSGIREVTKYSKIRDTSGAEVNNATSTDDVWIPSAYELGYFSEETEGPSYGVVFPDNGSRVKYRAGSAGSWWLRTESGLSAARYVRTDGTHTNRTVYYMCGVALGFCT